MAEDSEDDASVVVSGDEEKCGRRLPIRLPALGHRTISICVGLMFAALSADLQIIGARYQTLAATCVDQHLNILSSKIDVALDRERLLQADLLGNRMLAAAKPEDRARLEDLERQSEAIVLRQETSLKQLVPLERRTACPAISDGLLSLTKAQALSFLILAVLSLVFAIFPPRDPEHS